MEDQDFWQIVEATRGGSENIRLGRLIALLNRFGLDRISQFHEKLWLFNQSANTRAVWGAAIILNSGRCDDRDYCFSDFRNWLVFLGRDALFSVLDNPDLIANERLKENSDRLIFVGSEAYGKMAYYANAVVSEGGGSLCEVECQVEAHKILTPEWDTYSEEELESSYPRLWKKFGHCVRLFKQREYKRSQYEVQESEIKGLGCIYRGGRIWHKHFGEGVITHIFNYPGQYSTARIRFTDRLSSSFVFHDPDMFSLEAAKEENRGQATNNLTD